MEYKDVETPRQLVEFMYHHIQYGFVDEDGIIYADDEKAFQEGCKLKWKLSSPERLLQVGYGHCFDVTEFERAWFLEHGYEVHSIYISFDLPGRHSYSCHTYLISKKDNRYYFFEFSNEPTRGIYEFSSFEEAILFQKELHIKINKRRNPVGDREINSIHIYEYPTPAFGCTNNEFFNHIKRNGKEIILPEEKKYTFKIKMI